MSRIATAVLVCMLVVSSVSGAQNSLQGVPGFDAVARDLKVGEPIVVTDVDGTVTHGSVKHASPTTLVIRVRDQERSIDSFRIVRMSRPSHSIRNGALIGLAAGFTVGAIAAAASKCDYVCLSSPGGILVVGGSLGGIGMGVGALVGASFHREHVVFERVQH
jgi:hypothetical protein